MRQFARHAEIRTPYGKMFRKARNLTPRGRAELDAFQAAWTVAVYEAGHGCSAGGGDGLGSIVLPGRLQDPAALRYPDPVSAPGIAAAQPSAMR
jgi:hypothetical protein